MITDLRELQTTIEDLKQEVAKATDPDREVYLGKKGKFSELAQCLKTLLPENRKDAGKMLNELKLWLNEQLPLTTTLLPLTPQIDLTVPGAHLHTGHIHPMSQAINEITHIFEKIGFTRVRY
ncbi:hypothetical protein C5B42_03375, partial [Candidatus Cerribacteria bacterium 'Amazon FNV 2010 28 9']